MSVSCFIGIDIGTQGVRVAMIDESGRQLAVKEAVFELTAASRLEQDPQIWWRVCYRLLGDLCKQAATMVKLSQVTAIGVTSTSGTILPVNKSYQPLHPALMYSDGRALEQAAYCQQRAIASGTRGYTAFNASSGLPKMLWFLQNYPHLQDRLGLFIHAADFITGTLCGNFETTDYTNALKSGYDLHQMTWPDYIHAAIGIQRDWLQEVVPSGTPLGHLRSEWAGSLGLPQTVVVTAGLTDGCASQVASGAVHPGDWNTTIGTTLVVKGVTSREIKDPAGAIYCHRHPEGYWMPGGASNTGADWVPTLFAGADITALTQAAEGLIPGHHLAWPLMQSGERFPFVAPEARGFFPQDADPVLRFVACMEGVAYIERYAFERIAQLSGETITQVFSAGGGTNSDIWMRIRAAVMQRPVCKMQQVSGAAGAAITAASKTHFANLTEAAQNMIHPQKTLEPEPALGALYQERYQAFIQLLKNKGYLHE